MVDDAKLLRRYLLGELDESEQEAVEKKLMTSDDHFQELLIAEEELVDDYCAGDLDASEEKDYRERFLTTRERRFQHRFGEALRKHVADAAPDGPLATAPVSRGPFQSIWKISFAAAAAVVVIIGAWWIGEALRAPFQLEPFAEETQSTAAFFLTAGRLRSLQPEQTIVVPEGVAMVELQLGVPAERRENYGVTLETAEREVLAEGTLPVRVIEGEPVVVAAVPSALLPPGDYRIVLRDTNAENEVVETFEIRVRRP